MKKRVVLTGAESTGKTTLAERLAAHYETVWAPEYLRVFVEQKGALPELSDNRLIAAGHLAQVETLMARAHRVLFLDTDLVSTCVYSQHYFGMCPPWLKQLSLKHHADLYLLMDTDLPWHADPGQREGPAIRELLHARFQDELQQRGVSVVRVSGASETRLAIALRAVDALL